ncbi:MAG: mannose-6-phosphate isomerase, class I, partial [Ignavibacteriae bacterium]|nr:mannose-6-phosphate isomerase, class I [Ignavibacteriota bacterium]
ILSIEKALSIQTHPNKKVAKVLHKNDPKNYPDSNHKPEIAIAIDKLNAIVGLKNLENIKNSFIKYPQLNLLLSKEINEKLFSVKSKFNEDFIKEVYSEVMNASDRKIKLCVNSLLEFISQKSKKNKIEAQFLAEYNNYGFDVGLISLLLFNFIQLKKDEAIFTKAGIPHAYLGGNIVECMANSDNVVRAGLTSKFKDINTLTKILEIETAFSNVEIKESKNITLYVTPAEEFRIEKITLNKDFDKNKFITNGINIFLILDGIIEVTFGSKKSEIYKKGEAFFIPDCLKKFSINMKNDSKIFRVTVPIGISA